MPDGLKASINIHGWGLPPVFQWLMGSVSRGELFNTFNCGVGMVIVCSPNDVASISVDLKSVGETVIQIGVLN